jgi:CRP-like cAMP-binding protein
MRLLMAHPEQPIDNRLLVALMNVGGPLWRRHLERVDLSVGQLLYEPGNARHHAYFPTTAIVSLLYVMSNGATAEIAVVGNEGIVDTSVFLGGVTTTSHASVLIAGQGIRVGAQLIKDEFDRSDSIRHLLLRYTQAVATQIAQTAVCNRHHSIDQQVCGWLLHSLDRLRGSGEVMVTQELIASMLGVRRESVTQVAGRLQATGLICHGRGHISVLDRAGLERRACECHAVVKKEYDRLLPQEPAARAASPAPRMWPAWDDSAGVRLTSQHAVAAAFGI